MVDDRRERRDSKAKGGRVGIGLVFGMILGAAAGILLNNLALWAGIGLLVGIVVGGLLELRGRGDAK